MLLLLSVAGTANCVEGIIADCNEAIFIPIQNHPAPGSYPVTFGAVKGKQIETSESLQSSPFANTVVIGDGTDSDGDGFSDTFEITCGTNAHSFANTPANNVAVSANDVWPLEIIKSTIMLNFMKEGRDWIKASGMLPIPAGFTAANQKVYVDIGGVMKIFTLNTKGISKSTNDYFKLQIKTGRGAIPSQKSKFTMSLTHGSFALPMANELLGNSTVQNVPRMVMFSIVLGGAAMQKGQPMSYTAWKGRSGRAK